jgi:hypothetical protein
VVQQIRTIEKCLLYQRQVSLPLSLFIKNGALQQMVLQRYFKDLSANAWEKSNANISFKVLQCMLGCGRDLERPLNLA